ncbi:ribosome maturation factor RimP [Natronospora cellulosivora (SeqCode)]
MGKIKDLITEIAEPIIEDLDLELVDVQYLKEGEGFTLRVFIDNEKNEIGLDECEKVSRNLSEELDRIDPINDSYILEVSSPGIERPLNKLEDFDRFEGELAYIKAYAPINGKKEFIGTILKREDQQIRLEDKDKKNQVYEIPYSSIATANLTIDF